MWCGEDSKGDHKTLVWMHTYTRNYLSIDLFRFDGPRTKEGTVFSVYPGDI
jgi:hypothetical protein